MEPLARRVGRHVFIAFALLYIVTAHGRYFSDDVFQFEQVQVFVETGDFVMSPERDPSALGGAGAFMRPGVDGRVYLTLPPGLALTSAPLGWLGDRLGFPNPAPERPMPYMASPSTTFWASLTIPLVMAAAVWAMFVLVVHLSGSTRRGIQAACVFGLATSSWFFATTFWTQPLAAACLVAATTCLIVGGDRVASTVAAGALVGWAVTTRFEIALFVPWYLAIVPRRRWGRSLIAFALPLMGFAVALLAWNDFRFGDMLETRSLHQGTGAFRISRWPESLPKMLFGLDQGVVLYSPAILLAAFGARATWRSHRTLAVFSMGTAATMTLVYGAFAFWDTPPPITWGNRFLYPAIPLLVLLAFASKTHEPLRPAAARVLVGVSAVIALAGVLQRARAGPPVWWIDDPACTAAALVLLVPVVVLFARIRRAYTKSE